ncbi:MAG: GNAT family N-acetyltransferase [Clostridiales bacterium]|nr:GNAT family N-acetyltransferase [Clostridiales bacterium]
MRFAEKEIVLKDGRTCVLKPNSPEYAEQMIKYLKETSGETEFLLRNPDEVKFTLEEEQNLLAGFLDNPGIIMMAAVVDGKVAGNMSIAGIGPQRRLAHRCSLAIALYKEFWGLGIGTSMIGYGSELAAKAGWKQMDLEVLAGNDQAYKLYKKCGFIETGVRHNALRYDDGTCRDEILMYKEL